MDVAGSYKVAAAAARSGDFATAERACRMILTSAPDDASTLNLLSTCLSMCGRPEEAVEFSERAVAVRPKAPFYLFNLGDCYRRLGQLEKAIDCYQNSLSVERSPQAFRALGCAYAQRGMWSDAARNFDQSARLRPRDKRALIGLADALNHIPRPREAAQAARSALMINAKNPAAHMQFAIALRQLGLLTESSEEFVKTLELAPQDLQSTVALANIELERLRHKTAIGLFRKAMAISRGSSALHSKLLLAGQYDSEDNETQLLEEHKRWGADVLSRIPDGTAAKLTDSGSERTLRIGYLSPDLREHPVATFLEPVLASMNRERFHVAAFADVPRPDAATRRLKSLTQTWYETFKLDNQRLDELIREERIDFLVDLAGHTAFNRLPLFARRPAPIQVTYLGYPNTTGLPSDVMNYRITDAIADPPGEADQMHTEKLVRLPGCFLCYKPPADAPAVGPLPADANGFVTFGCFNAMPKLSQWLIELWAKLLKRVPTARLMLKNSSLGDEGVRADVVERFAGQGIEADRLIMLGREPSTVGHLGRYGQVDIALDSFPYNGTTTTCEAMWMGVPVVTLAGKVHRSRVGASLLSAVGLEELVANTPEGYVELAATLAEEIDKLRALRLGMRERMKDSRLMDAVTFTRNLEIAYRQMFEPERVAPVWAQPNNSLA